MTTLVIAHSHVQLHYNTQAEKQEMVARPQARQNVGRCMDGETYSKSAHVNDLGFAWTGPPCCMDRLVPLFAWTGPPCCMDRLVPLFAWTGPPCCMDRLVPLFAWTGPPCCMDRLVPLYAWTGPPPCSYGFSARRFYLACTHCTIPTSALVFGGNIFTHPLY